MKRKIVAVIILTLILLFTGFVAAKAGFTCYHCWSTNTDIVVVNDIGGTGTGSNRHLYHCYMCRCKNCRSIFWVDELHNTNGIDPAVAPNCTKTGWREGKKCTVCNKPSNREYLMPTGHTEVTVAALAPTCTEIGVTESSYCAVCHEVIVTQKVIPATGHTLVVDPTIISTCTETGLTEGSHCAVCHEVIVTQKVIPATGHTLVVDPAITPTCILSGLTEGSHCSVCKKVLVVQKVISALGHNDIVSKTISSTCDREGFSLMRCTRCAREYKANIEKRLSHWYGPWSPTEDGIHTSECVRGCGHTGSASCESIPITMAGITLSACPVCGTLRGEEGLPYERFMMVAVDGAGVRKTPGGKLPDRGELVTQSLDRPLGADSTVLRLYVLTFEIAGHTFETDLLKVSLPLDGLVPAFRLVCVSGHDTGMEIPFEARNDILVFIASFPGAFVLLAE